MLIASQQFIFIPLLHGFNNSRVSSAVPYSYLLFSMCNAFAAIGLSECPTRIYEMLQVLHLSLYVPLEFVLVVTILSVSCRCIVFVAHRAILKLECLKRLVFFNISGL